MCRSHYVKWFWKRTEWLTPPEDYEIDYIMAPRLGGVEDIRNLWPGSYRIRVWNAHVKDTLEERLHEMVCSGQLDLSTAIARDRCRLDLCI